MKDYIQSPTATFTVMTPDRARQLLELNKRNRPLNRKTVEQYGRRMAARAWLMDGTPIRIDTHNDLLDGQHRLTACVKYNAQFPTLLVTGLQPETQDVMDTGRRRSVSDQLQIRGVENGVAVGTALRAMATMASPMYWQPGDQECYMIFDAHPGIEESARAMRAASKVNVRVPSGALAAVHYIAKRQGLDGLADEWQHVWCDGVPAYEGCAAHALRERFIRNAMRGHVEQSRDKVRYVMSAWVKFCDQKPVKVPKPMNPPLPGWTLDDLGIPAEMYPGA